jgi:hypothetical protein
VSQDNAIHGADKRIQFEIVQQPVVDDQCDATFSELLFELWQPVAHVLGHLAAHD